LAQATHEIAAWMYVSSCNGVGCECFSLFHFPHLYRCMDYFFLLNGLVLLISVPVDLDVRVKGLLLASVYAIVSAVISFESII
jgi:hypothetical protein